MIYTRGFFLFCTLFLIVVTGFAQPGGGGDPGHGQPVPISGIGFLILAGGLLAFKKLSGTKNKGS